MKKEKSLSLFLSVALLLLLGSLIYSNTLHAPFYFDDYPNILFNPKILTFRGWIDLFNDGPTRSLSFLSFAINYKIGGTSSWGYHLVNLILHLLNSLFVFGITRLLLTTPAFQKRSPLPVTQNFIAFATALIFMCHPLQTQAVNYIVQRLALMASFFYLATLFLYLHFRISKVRASYLLGLFTALLSMLSKEIAFTLPAALLLCEILFFGQDTRSTPRLVKRLLPFVFISLLIPCLFFLNHHHMIQEGGQMALVPTMAKNISRSAYGITQLDVIRTYLELLVFPVCQTFDYDFPFSAGFFSPGTFSSFILLMTILILGFRLIRKQPLASFGIFFFFLALSVESSIIPLPDLIFEHRLYLPMVGFAFFAASCLGRFLKSSRLFMLALIALALILGTLTYRRNTVWANELLFWQDQTRKAPLQSRGYFHLGETYRKNHQYLLAADSFLKALPWKPSERRNDIHFNNVGSAYANAGQTSRAEYWYRKGLEAYPKSGTLRTNLAVLKIKEGDLEGAASLLKIAIASEPGCSIAHYELARIYAFKKEYPQAISLLERAIVLDPSLRPAKELLAALHEPQENQSEAP
jgi:tetratricopeptide (TPR) repeat protein